VLIALGSKSLASYPEGAPMAAGFMQYPLGLRALGHQVMWVELISASQLHAQPELATDFFSLMAMYDLADDSVLIVVQDLDDQVYEQAEIYGMTRSRAAALIRDADALWNFAASIRQPLLGQFRQRVLIDGDPGHLQVCALTFNFDIQDHQVLLSVGNKISDTDCAVPRLGRQWGTYRPYVHLPMWPLTKDPGAQAPFTSITQWSWEELEMEGRRLSLSKRESYVRYVALPTLTQRPFELAANIGPNDVADDRKLFKQNGWSIVEPLKVAGTPEKYQIYLHNSRAEILCCKPIYKELKTGWFSDRSAAYLASGRPVLMEDCGTSEHLPLGYGILSFGCLEEAAMQVAEIDKNYAIHARAARDLAEHYFGRSCLEVLLAQSFSSE
jgi:hypothetical protein